MRIPGNKAMTECHRFPISNEIMEQSHDNQQLLKPLGESLMGKLKDRSG